MYTFITGSAHCPPKARSAQAAEAIRRWTGVKAYAVCAVKPGRSDRDWKPVGQQSWKEIARDDGFYGDGNYHVLLVDETGTVKACTKKRFPLDKALSCARMSRTVLCRDCCIAQLDGHHCVWWDLCNATDLSIWEW